MHLLSHVIAAMLGTAIPIIALTLILDSMPVLAFISCVVFSACLSCAALAVWTILQNQIVLVMRWGLTIIATTCAGALLLVFILACLTDGLMHARIALLGGGWGMLASAITCAVLHLWCAAQLRNRVQN